MSDLPRSFWLVGNALCVITLLLVTLIIFPANEDQPAALLAYHLNTQARRELSSSSPVAATEHALSSAKERAPSSIRALKAPALQENFAFLSIGMESLDQRSAIRLSSHVVGRTLPSAGVVYRGSPTEVQLVTRVNATQTGTTAEGDVLSTRGREIASRDAMGGNHFGLEATDPGQRLEILNELASNYWRQHRYDIAEFLYRTLLQMQQELGLEHEHAATLDYLGMLLSERQRQAAAETYFWHAFVLREKLLGPYHPDVGRSLHNLAWQFTKGGYYSAAEPLYRRALSIAVGPDHLALADLLNNLAWLYTRQGRFKEAEPLYARSLRIKERELGATHPDVALALNNLAALYYGQGRSKHAGQNLERALAICSKAERLCSPSLLNSLAVLSLTQGRYDEALTLLRRTLKTARRSPRSELNAIPLLNTIAEIYNAQGRLGEAELVLRRAVLLIPDGAIGVEIAESLNNLSVLYLKLGQPTKAEPLARRSLAVLREAVDPSHTTLSKPMNTLALLARKAGRDGDAERLFNRSIELGGKSAPGAVALANLADLYMDQGQVKRAKQLRRRSAGLLTPLH